jgi:hypothetical protein
MWIKLHTAEQGRKNQNHTAEQEIGFYQNVGSYKCRRKMSILGCGITA